MPLDVSSVSMLEDVAIIDINSLSLSWNTYCFNLNINTPGTKVFSFLWLISSMYILYMLHRKLSFDSKNLNLSLSLSQTPKTQRPPRQVDSKQRKACLRWRLKRPGLRGGWKSNLRMMILTAFLSVLLAMYTCDWHLNFNIMLIGLVLYHYVAPLPDKLKIQTQTQKITLHLGNTLYASSMQKHSHWG